MGHVLDHPRINTKLTWFGLVELTWLGLVKSTWLGLVGLIN